MAEIMPFSAAPHKYKEKQSFRVEKMLIKKEKIFSAVNGRFGIVFMRGAGESIWI